MSTKLTKSQIQFLNSVKADINVISAQISDLLHKEDVFQNRFKPLAGKIDGYVFNEAVKNHYSSALVAIRRQLGMDNNEVSLKKLLKKLSNCNKWITEDWYASEWLKDSSLIKDSDPLLKGFLEGIPNSEFHKNFGKEGFLDKAIVEEDYRLLNDATVKIKGHVNNQLTHTNKKRKNFDLKDEDYKRALKIIEKLTKKYILLLNQVGMVQLTPAIQD